MKAYLSWILCTKHIQFIIQGIFNGQSDLTCHNETFQQTNIKTISKKQNNEKYKSKLDLQHYFVNSVKNLYYR